MTPQEALIHVNPVSFVTKIEIAKSQSISEGFVDEEVLKKVDE